MRSRATAKGRKLLFLAAVCLLPALLLSPIAEASRGVPSAALNLEPPTPRWEAEAPASPRLSLFHLEDELLVEILTGVEPEHHQALLEHRRLELLPGVAWTSAIQKTASGVSTSDLELNVQKGNYLKPDLRWTVPFYAKARFYDPEVGRFLTEDPAEPDLTTPPSLHRYLYAYGNPTYYTDPDGREVTITPKGNYVVSYPDGTVRTFTADRYEQNPAAVETAVLESVAGDEVAAKHDFQVGVLKWEYQQEHGTAPSDDEYIYQHSDETGPVYAITGSGEIHSASGDIEPDYSVETLAVTVVTSGFAASAVRVGGATLSQTSKVFVKNVADDLAGEVLGVNPSLVTSTGKAAIDRLEGGRNVRWTGKEQFDPSGFTNEQAENAILKSIRRKSGAKTNSAGQIVASADQTESMLRMTTAWRAGEKAADPALAGFSAGLKGTIVHSSVAKRMRALNISDLEINKRLYGNSPHLSPATGLPYEFRIPDYKIGDTILDIKPAGTPLTGPQASDFMLFGNTSDVRFIYYDQW